LEIVEHRIEHIVEVVYQAHALTAIEHAAYTIKMKQMLEKQRGPWGLLVDQRPLLKLDDKLKDKLLALYGYALKRGMAWSARVVRTPRDAQRLAEIVADEPELRARMRVFTSRREAFDWLRNSLRATEENG
jgi:hypothetical protein